MISQFISVFVSLGIVCVFVFVIGLIVMGSLRGAYGFLVDKLRLEFKTPIGWMDLVFVGIAFVAVNTIPALRCATDFYYRIQHQGEPVPSGAQGNDIVGPILICSVFAFSMIITAVMEYKARD